MGARAVLVKGGHRAIQQQAVDLLLDENGRFVELREDYVEIGEIHGSGCTLSAAIAAGLGKGKTLEDGGGVVMTADTWLGPEIASLKELTDFDLRYYKQLYGAEAMGLAAEQMAMVMAMYPMVQQASDRLKQEGDKLKGTPLSTTTTFEAVKSKAQMAEAANQSSSSNSGGGLGGMLARKMMKKEDPKARATIFTTQHEFQEVSTTVAGTDLDIPAGFKEKK